MGHDLNTDRINKLREPYLQLPVIMLRTNCKSALFDKCAMRFINLQFAGLLVNRATLISNKFLAQIVK